MPTAAKKITARKVITKKYVAPAGIDPTDEEMAEYLEETIDLVKAGVFDTVADKLLGVLDDRIIARANEIATEEREAVKTAVVASPKLPEPPKKKNPVATVTPKSGFEYLIVESLNKTLGGATVRFVRLRPENTDKAVVAIVTGRPGYPENKQFSIPVAALREMPARPKVAKTVGSTRKVAKSVSVARATVKTVTKKPVRKVAR